MALTSQQLKGWKELHFCVYMTIFVMLLLASCEVQGIVDSSRKEKENEIESSFLSTAVHDEKVKLTKPLGKLLSPPSSDRTSSPATLLKKPIQQVKKPSPPLKKYPKKDLDGELRTTARQQVEVLLKIQKEQEQQIFIQPMIIEDIYIKESRITPDALAKKVDAEDAERAQDVAAKMKAAFGVEAEYVRVRSLGQFSAVSIEHQQAGVFQFGGIKYHEKKGYKGPFEKVVFLGSLAGVVQKRGEVIQFKQPFVLVLKQEHYSQVYSFGEQNKFLLVKGNGAELRRGAGGFELKGEDDFVVYMRKE